LNLIYLVRNNGDVKIMMSHCNLNKSSILMLSKIMISLEFCQTRRLLKFVYVWFYNHKNWFWINWFC